ncbi:hypothetical protein PL263_18035 [Methylomonas sp. EFPC3]|uniref:tetratricopeptide repeat protein n=1 Tax=Methylomonas sp. EFPC3 TaxID=3021710 RepID=UPI002417ACD8|nr:tetratricopeptide repeat protein [Methylomonas sp. EFPC3]WFP49988.1 hypothetical protein PL263_18035 [Methylomonas sp. EFPC3]
MTESIPEPEHWSTQSFLAHFMRVHDQMPDRSFAFILGAGASRASGIPTGGELVQKWLAELHQRAETQDALTDWATSDNLQISGFDYTRKAEFYPQIYERRFRRDPEEGYADLEAVMADREPSFGYSVLSNILDQTRHKVVITTNFDNLVADALSIYTRSYPLVCGHESLAGFVRTRLRRPLIAKIHRDLLFAPINDGDGVNHLADGWEQPLTRLFSHHTPIVLGYGGNDGSLMDFLRAMPTETIPGGIFWCYRKDDGLPSDRIRTLVAQHNGALVPVVGFDEFMLQLHNQLEYQFLADAVRQRAEDRAKQYQTQVDEIQKRLDSATDDQSPETQAVKQALHDSVARQKLKSWWDWEIKAKQAKDADERERIYRAGLAQFPDSAGLTGNFANFMKNNCRDYDEAERLYRKAIELDPNDADYTGNFALFKANVRKNYDEAERLYRKALQLDPNSANKTGNFALFMTNIRKEYDEAESLYRKALQLDPNHANNAGNFATFMANINQDYDEAERLYRKALQLDPNSTYHTGNFACLKLIQNQLTEAETLARQAWQLSAGQSEQVGAEAALYLGLISRLRQSNDIAALGRLKTLLQTGFDRLSWSFDALLMAMQDRLDAEDFSLYSALAAAILDNDRVAELDQYARWREISPIELNTTWEDQQPTGSD